ncbi:hypothetical protein HMPREF1073_02163, partial [Bacteroides uniformis CL03T12C37]
SITQFIAYIPVITFCLEHRISLYGMIIKRNLGYIIIQNYYAA